jgi:hypothetical protein
MAAEFSLDQLSDLMQDPVESLDRKYTLWLDPKSQSDTANIAKALIALANSGGGFLVMGFREISGNLIPQDDAEKPSDEFDQDLVNGIVENFAEPPFHFSFRLVSNPNTGAKHPVISVSGSSTVPICAKRSFDSVLTADTYYIRRPGPQSEPPQSTSEWDELLRRALTNTAVQFRSELKDNTETNAGPITTGEMQRLEDWIAQCDARFDEIVIELADVRSRYRYGYWTIAYEIAPVRKKPSLNELAEFLKRSRGRETGWPPFWAPERADRAPKPRDGLIECLIARPHIWSKPARSDFWRASPEGFAYLLRGYQEDALTTEAPGSLFDMVLPAWRIGECLLQASRLASCFGEDKTMRFTARWRGLRGRRLAIMGSGERYADPLPEKSAAQDEIRSSVVTTALQILVSLPELVMELTSPLYSIFEISEPGLDFYRNEMQAMRNGGF